MSFFPEFMRRAFPDARVERLAESNHYRVSVIVNEKDVRAQSVAALSAVKRKMTPQFRPRRRLHWGPSKWGRR